MATDDARRGTSEETNGRTAQGSGVGASTSTEEKGAGSGGLAEKAQSTFGQVSDQLGSKVGPAVSQASDKAQAMAGQATERMQGAFEQAPDKFDKVSNTLFDRLQQMSSRDYYYAASASLGLTALLLLFGRRSLASFVGLWSAIILNFGLFSRIAREAEQRPSQGPQ